MSDQSGRIQDLFEAAFRDYERQTGNTLANHPFAQKLQSCNSVESITAVLSEQTEAFSEIREKDKVLKPLKNVVTVLHKLSSASDLGLPLPPVKAIHTGLGILISAIKGVLDDYDTLADLLESVEHFLNRLDIYTKISPTVGMTEMVVKILVEVLSILGLATKQLQQGKLRALFKKKLLRGKDVEAVLQRLDRLTGDEARITAAQTLEVVYGLFQNMRDVVDDGKTSINHARDALEVIQQLASDMNKSKRDKLEQDIRRWLSPPDPWKNHNIACKSRHRGSAVWFFEGDTYSEWKASEAPGSLLWVHGKPGAGKSILCSTIIEDIDGMRKAGLASLAFFYCDFREDQKRELRGLLSSLLVQLCHQSDSYSNILSKLYSEHANGSRDPSDDVLAGCLKDLLKLPGHAPVYLIVDALDECPNTPNKSFITSPREEVLNLVEELIKSQIPNVCVCVTSRPEMDINDVLDPLVLHTVSLHDEWGQRRDINEYIKSVINTNPKNKRWKAEDKRLVIDVLTRKAAGMFRWVYCQLAHICGCIPARIRRALDDLPETLDETYERTLREINKADWEFAHRIFQFVAVAARPLDVEELAELLAFDFETGRIPKFREDWRLEDPMQAVLSICPSFLAVVRDYYSSRKIVQFSHFSVKEFLTSARLAKASDIILHRYHISETPAHILATQVCLGYFLHLDKDVTSASLRNLYLAGYSARYWIDHVRLGDASPNVEDGLKELFDPRKPHLAVCIWLCQARLSPWVENDRSERPSPLHGTPLHYAALWDLHSIVEFLVYEHSQNVNSQDSPRSATPLHVASSKGYMKIARRLLECGANVKAQDENKETPLLTASKRGQLEVVRVLIEHNAALSAQDKEGRTPIHLASQEGKPEVIRVLIEHGADVSARDKEGRTPIHLASQQGKLKVIRMLIEHGAAVSAQDKEGRTPMHPASQEGKPEVIRVLIEHGADVSARDKEGRTPIHLASQEGKLEVIRVLIEHGADVSAQDKEGRTPMHLASEARFHMMGSLRPPWEAVICVLIEHGADVSAQDKDSRTPMHLASLTGKQEVIRLLIERGADVSAQDKDGRTPIHLASQNALAVVTRILIECGSDLPAQDKDGRTPLHLALQKRMSASQVSRFSGLSVVFRMLIEHGADVSAQDKEGRTPMHLASLAGRWGDIPVLIERGADVSAKDKGGRTPVHLASQAGELEVIRVLIEHGADVSARDKEGRTPVHLASQAGELEVIRMLIEHGADVSALDNDSQTLRHLD